VYGAKEAISREEALRLYTSSPAHYTFEEGIKGSIEPGKLADLVVLSADLLTVPAESIDDILPIAERLDLTRESIELLVTRGPALAGIGRLREGIVTLVGAVAASASYGLVVAGIRARVNLSNVAAAEDPRLAYEVAREGVDLMRHLGMRSSPYMLANAIELAIRNGDWAWVLPEVEGAVVDDTRIAARVRRAEMHGLLGRDVADELREIADSVAEWTEVQAQATVEEVRATIALARGETRDALELAQRSYRRSLGPDNVAPSIAARAAAWLGDAEAARDVLDVLQRRPGRVPEATRRETTAVLLVLDGRRDEGISVFIDSIRRWRDLGLEFEAATCALSLVTMVGPSKPDTVAAGLYAGGVFERIGAVLHLALLERVMKAVPFASPTRREAPVVADKEATATPAD